MWAPFFGGRQIIVALVEVTPNGGLGRKTSKSWIWCDGENCRHRKHTVPESGDGPSESVDEPAADDWQEASRHPDFYSKFVSWTNLLSSKDRKVYNFFWRQTGFADFYRFQVDGN